MNNSSLGMQVLYRTKKLKEIVPGEALVEAALLVLDLDEGKQVPLLNQL